MDQPHQRFSALFEELYPQVVRFVARRAGADAADDLAAETFAVAWRRYGDMPSDHDQQRAWVFGIARRLLLAQSRRSHRDPLPVLADANHLGHENSVVELTSLLHAWRKLSDAQREVIALTAWDNLTSAEAARVLDISPVAYRIRLSRARSAMSFLLEQADRAAATSSLHTQTGSLS